MKKTILITLAGIGAAAAFFVWQRRELSPAWIVTEEAKEELVRTRVALNRLFTVIDAAEKSLVSSDVPECDLGGASCIQTQCNPIECVHARQS